MEVTKILIDDTATRIKKGIERLCSIARKNDTAYNKLIYEMSEMAKGSDLLLKVQAQIEEQTFSLYVSTYGGNLSKTIIDCIFAAKAARPDITDEEAISIGFLESVSLNDKFSKDEREEALNAVIGIH